MLKNSRREVVVFSVGSCQSLGESLPYFKGHRIPISILCKKVEEYGSHYYRNGFEFNALGIRHDIVYYSAVLEDRAMQECNQSVKVVPYGMGWYLYGYQPL